MQARGVALLAVLASCAPTHSAPAPGPATPMESASLDGASLTAPVRLLLRTCVTPPYPETLRSRGIGGNVVVTFIVDTLGRAERGSLRRSAPAGELEPYVGQFILSCRFLPAQGGASLVRARTSIGITTSVSGGDVEVVVTPGPAGQRLPN
jgi:TonB family protein